MNKCPCLECPKFREWCKGTINASVTYNRDVEVLEANRLIAPTDTERGTWEREAVEVKDA